jgi:hypothetical protein
VFKQVHKLLLFLALLWALAPPSAQAQVINCPSGFSSSGACGVSLIGAGGEPWAIVGGQNGSSPRLNGSQVLLVPNGAVHVGLSLNYQTQVNVQAFAASFTFVPNGWNISFVINNSNNNPIFNGNNFSAGAGCEADFFQGFSQAAPPNNVFALELDSYSPLTESGSFTYSSAQIYQSGQSPCLPNLGGTDFTYVPIDKISTSPVPLDSPADAQGTSTGHTYSATISYDGSSLTLNLYDVTAGGSCPGPSCFTHTWTEDGLGNPLDIPSIVGGDLAWVGFGGGTYQGSSYPLYVNSVVYNEGTTSAPPAPTPPAPALPTPAPPTPAVTPAATPAAASTPAPTPSPASVKKHHKK